MAKSFHSHLNSIELCIQFTVKEEAEDKMLIITYCKYNWCELVHSSHHATDEGGEVVGEAVKKRRGCFTKKRLFYVNPHPPS